MYHRQTELNRSQKEAEKWQNLERVGMDPY